MKWLLREKIICASQESRFERQSKKCEFFAAPPPEGRTDEDRSKRSGSQGVHGGGRGVGATRLRRLVEESNIRAGGYIP